MSPEADFTEGGYVALLELAARRYRFVRYTDNLDGHGLALWRHDVDFSPQRALALARIEAERKLRATYFVQLTSRFYSALEPEVAAIVRAISALGHDIGLHFDPELHAGADLGRRLTWEAGLLKEIAGCEVRVFSLHNPTTISPNPFVEPRFAGLVNATAPVLGETFTYCSDSNGVWRHCPLAEVLADPVSRNVHVLTHPEWWPPEQLAPRARIRRCIDGRAAAASRYYDGLLARHGRPNAWDGA